MREIRLIILGGYGNTGLPLARFLLRHTDVKITLAGRRLWKAQSAADQLNEEFPGKRANAAFTDAGDRQSLDRAFEGKDMVVVASSTVEHVKSVAEAALKAHINYFDLQFSTEKLQYLQSIERQIEKAGCCFITDGGFHPGLPAAMVRFAARQFDSIRLANVGSVIQIDWKPLNLSDSTLEEFVLEFMGFKTDYFANKRWRRAGFWSMMVPRWMDFGGVFGRRYTLPMFLEEFRSLPKMFPALEETGFFVGGFNWFVDWFLSPVLFVWLKLLPHRGTLVLGKLLRWGLDTFSSPPYGTVLRLEAEGIQSGKEATFAMQIAHDDGYMLTAIPAAACLFQYLEGRYHGKTGLFLQAEIVETIPFFDCVERLGAEVEISIT